MNQNFIEQEQPQTTRQNQIWTTSTWQDSQGSIKQNPKQQTPTASKLTDYNKQLPDRNQTDYNKEWRFHLYTNSKQEDKLLNLHLAKSLVLTS
jgi:hypothetical protein